MRLFDVRWLHRKNPNLHLIWNTEMILSYRSDNLNDGIDTLTQSGGRGSD